MSIRNKIIHLLKFLLSSILIIALNHCAVRGKLTLPPDEKQTIDSKSEINQKNPNESK